MTKNDLKCLLHDEKMMYVPQKVVFCGFTHHKRWLIWKYIAYHRKSQYWKNYKWKTVIDRSYAAIAYRLCLRKKNKYGECSGVEICNSCRIGRNLNIFHGGL